MIARLVVLEITGRHKTIEPGSKSSTKLYTIYDENEDILDVGTEVFGASFRTQMWLCSKEMVSWHPRMPEENSIRSLGPALRVFMISRSTHN